MHDGDTPAAAAPAGVERRGILQAGLLASVTALVGQPAAARPARRASGMTPPNDARDEALDAFAISQLVIRERLAREIHDYDGEADCFLPDAAVEVSWFAGTAAEFIAAGRKSSAAGANSDSAYFDSLGPASVTVHGDRAITDSACAIHTFLPLAGVQASMTSFTRLLCRVRKSAGAWRIAGLRAIYIRDLLEPCNPAEIPPIDLVKLNQHRLSYRHLSYALQANGRPLRDDLPGVDRPDGVSLVRAGERAWLRTGR